MIKVKHEKNVITISGHANYAEFGKDIICASVSSIVYTTVNGILLLNENAINFEDDESKMIIEIINEDEIVKKLIHNMNILFSNLEKQYPKNLKIIK